VRILAIGLADEMCGFALAGVETSRCQTPQDAEALLSSLGAGDSNVGLLIVSATIDRSAQRAIAHLRRTRGAPVVVVLPEPIREGRG
jgi:vacuolar-type H+-ATPase subunit F/Vma7